MSQVHIRHLWWQTTLAPDFSTPPPLPTARGVSRGWASGQDWLAQRYHLHQRQPQVTRRRSTAAAASGGPRQKSSRAHQRAQTPAERRGTRQPHRRPPWSIRAPCQDQGAQQLPATGLATPRRPVGPEIHELALQGPQVEQHQGAGGAEGGHSD
jgi:hypothetical protein